MSLRCRTWLRRISFRFNWKKIFTGFYTYFSCGRATSNKSCRFSSIGSIEFGNRTNRKFPVPQLCLITEPIEQKFDRWGSIEFDRFLVHFCSISYAGINTWKSIQEKLHNCQRPKTWWTWRVILIIAENKPQIQDLVSYNESLKHSTSL